MNILRKALLLGTLILGGAASSHAQFIGFSVDSAIGYTMSQSTVSGGSVGITHPVPLVPNLGYSTLRFKDDEASYYDSSNNRATITTTMAIQSYHLFYHVPFPVVSMALGFGLGSASITNEYGGTNLTGEGVQSVPLSEGFIRIGLPLWSFIEFHLGYHAFSMAKVDLLKGSGYASNVATQYNIEERNYTGGMTTVGLQFAF
jgi:hypothetical protein